jgi:hypothetical protein
MRPERQTTDLLFLVGNHLATAHYGVHQLESLDFTNPWLTHSGGSAQKLGDWLRLLSA